MNYRATVRAMSDDQLMREHDKVMRLHYAANNQSKAREYGRMVGECANEIRRRARGEA